MRLNVKFGINSLRLDFGLKESNKLDARFNCYQRIIATEETVERYKGEYEVTPTVDGGTLPTNQKFMEKDLVVNPIPVYETTNTSGGQTVYIAKE